MKKWMLTLLKLIIAAVAMYIAFRHINWHELRKVSWNTSFGWLLPAVILYNASQFISAYRLLQYYKLLDTGIAYLYNLRLYYTGMFYNLFLPGGVGGDVYKVMILKKRGVSILPATKATLLDRTTGLLVLLSMLVFFFNFIIVPLPANLVWIFSLAIIPCFLIYWLIVRGYLNPFNKAIPKAVLLSVIIQSCQVFSFFCLLLFLRAPGGDWIQYAVLFFSASVVAAIPVSIGGIGTRELTMVTGAVYLHVSQTIAVSASLLFYILTALSAVAGWLIAKKHPFK